MFRSSENPGFLRARIEDENGRSSIRFEKEDGEKAKVVFEKLDKDGNKAKSRKQLHGTNPNTLFKKGRESTLKLYENFATKKKMVVKTIENIQKYQLKTYEARVRKMRDVGEKYKKNKIYDFEIRENKYKTNFYKMDILMEFHPGETLFDFRNEMWKKQLLLLGDVIKIFSRAVGIVGALEIFHNSYGYHMDFKLENIVWDEELDGAVLIDFETAMAKNLFEQGNVKLRSPLGTPNYIPPEMFDEEIVVDGEKSDLHCLGMALAFLFKVVKGPTNKSSLDGKRGYKVNFDFDHEDKNWHLAKLKELLFQKNDRLAEELLNTLCLLTAPDPKNRIITLSQVKKTLIDTLEYLHGMVNQLDADKLQLINPPPVPEKLVETMAVAPTENNSKLSSPISLKRMLDSDEKLLEADEDNERVTKKFKSSPEENSQQTTFNNNMALPSVFKIL